VTPGARGGQSSRFVRFLKRVFPDLRRLPRAPGMSAEIACSAVSEDIVQRTSRRERMRASWRSTFSSSESFIGEFRSGTTSDLSNPMRVPVASLLLLSLAGCGISESDEVALGARYAEEIDSQVPLIHDPRVNAYVNDLGRAIARTTPRADLEWRFRVVDAPEVNAFALPGGYIYVNRGLIERAERLDQFAGVIGHEIGHVVLRHSVDRLEKATRTNVGVTIFCGITSLCESVVSQAVINIAGNAWFARHSRADEAAADSNAVVNVVRSGIHPGGIPAFFEALLETRERSPGALEGWFRSHPLEEDRVRATRELVESIDRSQLNGLRSDSPDYQAFRRLIASLPPSPPSRPPPQ
jgi:beta-barrel assembly-enhancing protease